MKDYGFGTERILLIMLAIGILGSFLLWGVARPDLILGFVVGVMAALAYTLLLRYQVTKAGRMPWQKALMYFKGSWAPRFFLVAAIVLYCLHIPEIKIIALLGGLFISFRIIVLINSIFLLYQEYSYKGVENRHAV